MQTEYQKKTLSFATMPELPYSVEEAVNRLRVNINFLGRDIHKIMIVSSLPDEGKSFVTMQLWRQMAERGTSTLLIDADLRKSVLTDKYDMTADDGGQIQGTSHYLSGDSAPEEAIYHTHYGHGDILPNVDNVINPSLLIENSRFQELMDYADQHYQYTFIDCPPLGMVSDGEQIANMCDGAILCVRAGDTSKSIVRNTINQLKRAGCPLLGIVLNRVNTSTGSYYHKYYGNKYYSDKYYTDKK